MASGRMSGETNLAVSVKKALAEIDPNQPVTNIMTMEDVMVASVGDFRFYMELLGIFAGVAVLLGGVGVFCVMFFSVRGGHAGIGVPHAPGGEPRDRLWLNVQALVHLIIH